MAYRPRSSRPLLIVRATAQTLRLEVWDDAARATPSSGTLSLYDGDDTAIVSAAAVTVDSQGRATYALLAATVPATLPYSDSWRAVWTLVIGGSTEIFEQPAVLARSDWRAPVTRKDLENRHGEFARGMPLDPAQDPAGVEPGDWITEAVDEVWLGLWQQGRRPWLIVDAWAARQVILFKALEVAFRWGATFAKDSSLLEHAATYLDKFESEWGKLQFRYDSAETGKPADAPRISGPAAYLLTSNRPLGVS